MALRRCQRRHQRSARRSDAAIWPRLDYPVTDTPSVASTAPSRAEPSRAEPKLDCPSECRPLIVKQRTIRLRGAELSQLTRDVSPLSLGQARRTLKVEPDQTWPRAARAGKKALDDS